MENINYNGVDGVFIPNNEMDYINNTIKINRVLMEQLLKEIASNSNYDELMGLNYNSFK